MTANADAAPTELQECLARFDTDHSSLLASIDNIVGLGSRDRLLAVGSTVEGLGNSKSDLDLLLVAYDRRAETEMGWAIGRRMVDLRVVRATTVDELLARLSEWARLPWNLMELAPFSYDERLLLHRLQSGLDVYPAQPDPARHTWRPQRTELARLKLQVARHMARTIQVDMVGYRDDLDYASLVFASQELLGHSVDGLLAAYGLTNPNPKWRSRLLQRLPADWGQQLTLRPTGLPADRAIWTLHRAPAEPERGSAVTHALRCTTFARAVFASVEPHLIGNSAMCSVTHSWACEADMSAARPLPGLEFDVDFFFSSNGIAASRLNEFGRSMRLTEQEFEVLLLCDGRTTAREAEALIHARSPDCSAPLDVDATVDRVVRGGLCLPSPAKEASRA